jgi:UDP-N-acetyl-D-mannosaminuronate dehydrogenase
MNRYVSEGNDRKIRENESAAEDIRGQIASTNDAKSTIDATISSIQDELGKSESYRANINFNIMDRSEIKQIKSLQDKIAEIDLDSMAKARKEFNLKYKDKMEEEKNVADAVRYKFPQFIERETGADCAVVVPSSRRIGADDSESTKDGDHPRNGLQRN